VDATLAKGLAVLDWLARQQRACRVVEVARALGLTRSNAHRTLQTLVECGWATQESSGGAYRAGWRVFELGSLVHSAADLRTLAHPHLAALAQVTGETIHLAVLDGAEIVYLDKIDGALPVVAYSRVGGRAPAACVASGKAILAALAEPLPQLQARLGPLQAHTANSITDYARLGAELARTRERGFALNREEWRLGVCGLGAPVFDAQGHAVAAVGISVPSIRLARSRVRLLSERLLEAAARVAGALGHNPAAGSPPHHATGRLAS